jgi:TDG/mug DNA glycosylase family protein
VHPQLLKDRIRLPVRVLLVGINPGIRSAQVGHHFAGPSNRFWKLLYESRLVPEPIGFADDDRLPEWGFGLTNLIARPTPGIDSLRPDEYIAGAKALRRKIRRLKPEMVAFIGVTLFRSVFGIGVGPKVAPGPREERIEGARVFVLPNPSGRNANFSYRQMLDAFVGLRRAME